MSCVSETSASTGRFNRCHDGIARTLPGTVDIIIDPTDIVDDHCGTSGSQQFCVRSAQSTPGPRHDRHLAIKSNRLAQRCPSSMNFSTLPSCKNKQGLVILRG